MSIQLEVTAIRAANACDKRVGASRRIGTVPLSTTSARSPDAALLGVTQRFFCAAGPWARRQIPARGRLVIENEFSAIEYRPKSVFQTLLRIWSLFDGGK